MALLRQLVLLLLAPIAAYTTLLPIAETGPGHFYGCGCGDDLVVATIGAFVPALLIAFVAARRLFGHSTPMPDVLPTATLRASPHRRWLARYRELNARVARDFRGNRTQRICAWLAFVLGAGMLLPGCDGPGKLPVGLTHLALWAIGLMPPFKLRG